MRFDICLQLVCVVLASWADKEVVTVLAYSFSVLLDLLVIYLMLPDPLECISSLYGW